MNDYPQILWKHHNWEVKFGVIPKNTLRGQSNIRPIGITAYDVVTISNPFQGIKTAINTKAGKYETGDIPYLVALNAFDSSLYNDEDVVEALFGTLQLLTKWHDDGSITSRIGRVPDGAWYGPKGFQKKRMSGLLLWTNLKPFLIHKQQPVLWHHPSPNVPLSPDKWLVAQKIPNFQTGRYDYREGLPIDKVLGIDINKLL